MNYQFITVMGRATKDNIVLESKKGKKFTKFSVAVNKYRGKKLDPKVNFFDVLGFNKQSKSVSKKVKKGDLVFAAGSPEFDVYETKKGEAQGQISCMADYVKVFTEPEKKVKK